MIKSKVDAEKLALIEEGKKLAKAILILATLSARVDELKGRAEPTD